ncbi:MAG TPA: hypothetical protein VFR86_08705, partial [Burkholderiaceae bacterium]|nr:hypothetical protein [Burkholderiaceae bacterium]
WRFVAPGADEWTEKLLGAVRMKKLFVTAPLAVAMGIAGGTALAASISNLNGQTCPTGTIGSWHFVNNQTGGAAAGTLNAAWDSGNLCMTGPSQVNQNTQHFLCTATGMLTSASTNLPGRLVLSDFTCTDIKEPPPPPPPPPPPK